MSEKQMAKCILIIDDDAELRELMKLLLESEGFKTLEASNGEEAIKVIQHLDISKLNLILLDLIMPVMDGFVFLHWLRTEMKSVIPVLVLSGRKTPDTLDEVLASGASGLIYKPLDAVDFIERIKNQLLK